jgi:hypothetical protein
MIRGVFTDQEIEGFLSIGSIKALFHEVRAN